MRPRTAVLLLAVIAALLGGGAFALVAGDAGGSLSAAWVSDTPRNSTLNHHGVGANAGVVVAPTAERGGVTELSKFSCSLVRLDAGDGSTRWRHPVPRDRCFLHALTRPTVADLDGDGDQEVLAGTIENATVVLDADGEAQFRVPMTTYGYPSPTVTDLTGDGANEIVTSDIEGGVVVAAADGTVRWRANVTGVVWDSPLVVDLDGDGAREVVVGSSQETVAFATDGTVLWRQSVSGNDVAVTRIDGSVAVVTVGFSDMATLDGETGERRWNRSGLASPSSDALGDGDGDGQPELYVGLSGDSVAAVDATTGEEEWRTQLVADGDGVTPPVLADVSGDGDRELVAATADGTVAVLDPTDGAELAAYERDVPVWTAVTPADLTDDPGRELLVRYGDGRVVLLTYEA